MKAFYRRRRLISCNFAKLDSCTLDSAYIGIGYTVFSAIPSIFRPNFGSQKEVYIIHWIPVTSATFVPAKTDVIPEMMIFPK